MGKVCWLCFHRIDGFKSAVFASQFSNPEQQLCFIHFQTAVDQNSNQRLEILLIISSICVNKNKSNLWIAVKNFSANSELQKTIEKIQTQETEFIQHIQFDEFLHTLNVAK